MYRHFNMHEKNTKYQKIWWFITEDDTKTLDLKNVKSTRYLAVRSL